MNPHRPRKRFGQNFLQDTEIIAEIIAAIRPQPGQHMLEIGPGLGALTAPLLERLGQLHVIEIDRDLIARLQKRFPANSLLIHEGDALKFDYACLGSPLRVVGNLPYNISTPLLFHLAQFAPQLSDLTFMLQKEVVSRMVAVEGTPNYGRLSVMLQYRFRVVHLFDVPPTAFSPAPKVTSSIVQLLPMAELTLADEALFARLVMAAFGQRRKTLHNTLRDFLQDTDFAALDICPGLRGERLSVAQFVRIANYLTTKAEAAA